MTQIYPNMYSMPDMYEQGYGKRKSVKPKSTKPSFKNRPKSAKMCAKRHMKWNKSTKRCNKKM